VVIKPEMDKLVEEIKAAVKQVVIDQYMLASNESNKTKRIRFS
jgi:hypothetical protein